MLAFQIVCDKVSAGSEQGERKEREAFIASRSSSNGRGRLIQAKDAGFGLRTLVLR